MTNSNFGGTARSATLLLAAAIAGCGAPGSQDDNFDESATVGNAEQGIYAGYTTGGVQHSTIVKVWEPKPDGSRGLCSGAMMKNLAIITARHCVDEHVNNPGNIKVEMGTQVAFGSQIWLNTTSDVAIVRLTNRLATYVNGQISYFNYVRAIYTGSDSSLNGRSFLVLGYGLDNACDSSGVLRHAVLTATDDGFFGQIKTFPNSLGQISNVGDSGGPLLDGISSIASPIAGVQTDCTGYACGQNPPNPPDVCWYDTPEDWGGWAYLLLYNIPQ